MRGRLGLTLGATLTLLVACEQEPPRGPTAPICAVTGTADDAVWAQPGVPIAIDVLDRYEGVESTATVQIVTAPFLGGAVAHGRRIFYTPGAQPGRDLFAYRVRTAHGPLPSALMRVAIAPTPVEVGPVRIVRQAIVNHFEGRLQYQGEDLSSADVRSLAPLVHAILGAYGTPPTPLDRARALRDWVARTAIHPYSPFHPDGTDRNLAVLPPGATWADVNAIGAVFEDGERFERAHRWAGFGYDGRASLDLLLGTLDPVTGERADDGDMAYLGGAAFQIKDLDTYHWVLCSYQVVQLKALLAAAGLQGMLLSTVGHDPHAVFIPGLGKWVYEDPTYNEEFRLDGAGDPLSPMELLVYSLAGEMWRLKYHKAVAHPWRADEYPDPALSPYATYFADDHFAGMVIMGSQLNNHAIGVADFEPRSVQLAVPALARLAPYNDQTIYQRVTPPVAFPDLGVGIAELTVDGDAARVRLASSFPGHVRFERRVNAGPWTACAAWDRLPEPPARVTYRSVDDAGRSGMTAVLQIGGADAIERPITAARR
ncbi:MAG TPA: hypothetical protein VGQ83_31465 [Polyangia bacterium]|jgi:hypothetical protein